MSFLLKVKLIRLVKRHQCIYNPAHSQYKNISYKTSLWNDIGTELNMAGKYRSVTFYNMQVDNLPK